MYVDELIYMRMSTFQSALRKISLELTQFVCWKEPLHTGQTTLRDPSH